jgi:hypothetical protein
MFISVGKIINSKFHVPPVKQRKIRVSRGRQVPGFKSCLSFLVIGHWSLMGLSAFVFNFGEAGRAGMTLTRD